MLGLFSSSCVAVLEGNKDYHTAGISTSKNYLSYTIKFSLKESFEIVDFKLQENDKEFTTYYYDHQTNLSTSLKQEKYEKGSYSIKFQIPNTINWMKKETGFLILKTNNKIEKKYKINFKQNQKLNNK